MHSHTWNNLSVIEVAKALEMHFNCNDLVMAREMLRQMFPGKVGDLEIGKISMRRATTSRSCQEALDISEAVHFISNSDEAPRFIAMDIKKLPLIPPRLTSAKNQSESILLLEKKMECLEERMKCTDGILKKHEEHIIKLQKSNSVLLSFTPSDSSLPLHLEPKNARSAADYEVRQPASNYVPPKPSTSTHSQPDATSEWQQQQHERKQQKIIDKPRTNVFT